MVSDMSYSYSIHSRHLRPTQGKPNLTSAAGPDVDSLNTRMQWGSEKVQTTKLEARLK